MEVPSITEVDGLLPRLDGSPKWKATVGNLLKGQEVQLAKVGSKRDDATLEGEIRRRRAAERQVSELRRDLELSISQGEALEMQKRVGRLEKDAEEARNKLKEVENREKKTVEGLEKEVASVKAQLTALKEKEQQYLKMLREGEKVILGGIEVVDFQYYTSKKDSAKTDSGSSKSTETATTAVGSGYHKFEWKEPGGEVFVTGSFDDWATPVKLDKVGNGFSKTIDLSFAKGEKIFFKFIVDGVKTVSLSYPSETNIAKVDIENILMTSSFRVGKTHSRI